MFQKKRLLIWGTTYPEFSKTYHETVCTGGIDADSGALVRIYPIRLRYLDERFHKYQWIEAEIEKSTKDPRPESSAFERPILFSVTSSSRAKRADGKLVVAGSCVP